MSILGTASFIGLAKNPKTHRVFSEPGVDELLPLQLTDVDALRIHLHANVFSGASPKVFFVAAFADAVGKWCDTVNGEQDVAVCRANAAPSPDGHENLRITSGRLRK